MKHTQVDADKPANDTDPIRCSEVFQLKLARLPRGQARPTYVPKEPDKLWSGYRTAGS